MQVRNGVAPSRAQRPSAVLMSLFCPRMKPLDVPAAQGPFILPLGGAPGGLALLLSPDGLLWGERSVLSEPCLCIPADPEPQMPISQCTAPV